MYVHDAIPSESSPYRRPQRRSPDSAGPARHGEYVRNSTGLTDGFDAPTEAPTEWNTGVDGVEGRDYEISVSGYRNYVHEMERMLDEQADSVRSLPRRRRASGSDSGGARARQRSLRSYASKDDVRRPDVVQSRTAGEGPSRSISLWRERVAQSSTEDERIDALHHEAPARQVAASKAPASKTTGRSSGSGSKSKCMSKGSSGDYERTEYIISYQQSNRNGPITQQVYTASELGVASPRVRRRGSPGSKAAGSGSQAAPSASVMSPQKTSKTSSHSQYMMTYLHTPPHSQDSSRSSLPAQPASLLAPVRSIPPPSPPALQAAAASPVDLLLSSCTPSLAHLGPVLAALGISTVEHLRAVQRLSERTRNRELREPALARGVTVLEWAILLDKILTL